MNYPSDRSTEAVSGVFDVLGGEQLPVLLMIVDRSNSAISIRGNITKQSYSGNIISQNCDIHIDWHDNEATSLYFKCPPGQRTTVYLRRDKLVLM